MGENSKNRANQRDIGLLDLLLEIMLRWRVLIVLMLVGGVLFAGLSYILSYRSMVSQITEIEQAANNGPEAAIDPQLIEAKLTEIQINNVKSALIYEQLLEDRMSYCDTSVIMKLDPENIPKAEITWLIKSDDIERTYNIQKIYEDIVVSTGLYNYLQEQCGLTFNPSETVALERTSYGEQSGTDTVRIQVVHNDANTCEKIANDVVAYVEEQRERLLPVLGEHEVLVLEHTFGTVMIESSLDKQKTIMAEIVGLRTNSTKLKDAFSDEEWEYYNCFVMDSETDDIAALESGEDVVIPTPSINVKYVILGMLLFAFLGVFVVFAKYIMNTKIRMLDDLMDVYGIPQLGLIETHGNKKPLFGFVDKGILAIRDRHRRKFTVEEAIDMAAVAVKMATKKALCDKVHFVGCDIKNQTADVCEKLQAILAKENIEAEILDNVLYNAEAMAGLENAKCVVLVEKAGSTMYEEISKELDLMSRQGITVLGGIIAE